MNIVESAERLALRFAQLGLVFDRDLRGIAAVEFAFVLPVMLTLYLGCVEVTQGVVASRQINSVSRTLADLASQQAGAITDTSTAPGPLGSPVSQIWDASLALFPQATTTNPIKMTLSSVVFMPTGTCSPTCTYNAKTSWSTVKNGGTPRPCGTLTPVANSTNPAPNAMPVGLYGSGSVIVADVSYTYKPTFGYVLINNIAIQHTTYMKPRTQTTITFNPVSSSEKCTGIP